MQVSAGCRYTAPILSVALLALALAGCSTPQRQFTRALALEREGKYAAALAEYRSLLGRIPPSETGAISKTQAHIGECLWHMQQPNEALRAFERAAAADSGNLGAHLSLAEIYLAGGVPNVAAAHAQFVVAQQPDNADALTSLGTAYAAMGQVELATTFYERALQSQPAQTLVAIQLADLYDRMGKPQQARVALEKASIAAPQDATVRIALGRLQEQEGNLPAAEEAYRSAVAVSDTPETNYALAQYLQRASRIPEAELVLRRVDKRNPGQPSRLADFEMLAGRPANALQRYTRELTNPDGDHDRETAAAIASRLVEADLAETRPGRGVISPPQRARIHLEQYRQQLDATTLAVLEAEIALAEGNFTRAQEKAAAAVATSPQSAAAHYALGIVKFSAGDRPAARNEWQAALEADGSFVPARIALGRLAFESEDMDEAGAQFAAVLRQEPANIEALMRYARVLAARNDFTPALQIARRAIAVDPSSPLPNVLLGDLFLQQQRPGQALVYFEKAVLLDPDSHEAIEGLTRVYQAGHVTRPMLRHMESIAAHEPRSATLYELVARLYSDHGWFRDAIRTYQAALQIQPGRTAAAAGLAKAFASAGQPNAAARSAQRMGGASADLLAALDAQKRNDVSTAIDHYEASVRSGESTGIAANNLAWLYAESGTRLDRALSLAQSARDLAPDNASFLDTLGYVHLRRREYSDALSTLKKAVQLASADGADTAEFANFRAHLAEAYRLAGEPGQAEKITGERQR